MKVKLKNNENKIENLKGLDINKGVCEFPFKYKDIEYNECYKGKKGDWCATEVNPKTKKAKKWAYCDPENSKPKLKIKTKTKTKKLKIMRPFQLSDVEPKYHLPKLPNVKPSYYVLPNNKGFINWFESMYSGYRVKKDAKLVKSAKFSFFNHQKIIRDYISADSPYRGLLLYHGLGVGKTCGSIAIAEGFRSNRKIVVLLNTSLEKNFKVNLMRCGYDYFRTNQHWFFHKFEEGEDPFKKYARYLGIGLKRNLDGAWFVDFSKEPNYDSLKKEEQEQLDDQINRMIKSKYEFLHMDGLNEKKLKKLNEDRALDNCILIIDEVHNLTNAMAKAKPGIRARYLEELIMNADNLKVVFLSGTPMINNLFETAKLFNLLRGRIPAYEVIFKNRKSSDINWDSIENYLAKDKTIDQILVKKRENIITVTRVPRNYIKQNNKIIESTEENDLSDNEFKEYLIKLVPDYASVELQYYTALPDESEKFESLFYDAEKNEIKNVELFKSRILGLVSFYKTQDKSLVPSVGLNELVEVPMSDYQFINYAKVRKAEIEQDKNRKSKKKGKKKQADDEEEIFEAKSSYRAYSRMHCSFVFPETIERPLPATKTASMEELSTELSKMDAIQADEGSEDYALVDEEPGDITVDMKKHIKAYERAREKALSSLYEKGQEYLLLNNPDQLMKYSPKYNTILNNITKTNGLAFIYTEYKTLEGIAILSVILKVNGYAEFKLKKKENGEYTIDEAPEDKDKPKFAFWAGSEEQSDYIRKIYNNEFSVLPTNLREELAARKKNNLRGDVIKILLTTKTGAEGIDLKNVRQVHIVEPYWNPVRLQQVKGRAIRVGSHIELPKEEQVVDIFVYLATILPKHKKTEPIIERDQYGISSDQALFNLSEKKLAVMKSLLKMVKEVSIDCSLNFNDTFEAEDPFTCLNYGSGKSHAYVPNINDEFEDREQRRRTVQTSWKPTIITIPNKGKFALKPAPPNEPQLLYDLETLREGRGKSGEPIGELIKREDGKTSVKFYKKATVEVRGRYKKTKNKKQSQKKKNTGSKKRSNK